MLWLGMILGAMFMVIDDGENVLLWFGAAAVATWVWSLVGAS
jgi:hypothetical protein